MSPLSEDSFQSRKVDVEAIHSLAASYMLFENNKDSLSLIRLALWIEPDHPRAVELLVHGSFKTGDFATTIKAAELLKTIVSKMPFDALRYWRLAELMMRKSNEI